MIQEASSQQKVSKFLPFEQARAFVRKLGLKNSNEWNAYRKSCKKPADIPANPTKVYKKEWQGLGNWLGTGTVAPQNREYWSYEQSRDFVCGLNLKSEKEWRAYCKSGEKPAYIPSNPRKVYSQEWQGVGDWLGTGSIASFNRTFLSFAEARDFVQTLPFKCVAEWGLYCLSGKKPATIPSSPEHVYKQEWQSWGDWFGTGTIATFNREYWFFEDARTFVRALALKGQKEWLAYCRSGAKPATIPSNPNLTYKQEWQSWGDWLGTGTVAYSNRTYLPFEDARSFVRELGIKNTEEWLAYCRSGAKPATIPSNPNLTYKQEWQSWGDWFGTGTIANRYRIRTHEQKLAQARVRGHHYRARKKTVLGTHTDAQILDMLKRHRYRCYYCRTKLRRNKKYAYGYEVDIEHTFPLARVSGTDIPANGIEYLVPACKSCNSKKQDKFPWEWEAGGRLL